LATSTPLVAVELLFGLRLGGSLVCLALVANVARRVLDGPSQVVFFRAIGRRYGIVGTVSLLVAIGVGLARWRGHLRPGREPSTPRRPRRVLSHRDGALAMVQARAMTRLRRRGHEHADDDHALAAVRRGQVAGEWGAQPEWPSLYPGQSSCSVLRRLCAEPCCRVHQGKPRDGFSSSRPLKSLRCVTPATPHRRRSAGGHWLSRRRGRDGPSNLLPRVASRAETSARG